jgi:hypothetical protein
LLKPPQPLSQTRFNRPSATYKTSHFSDYRLYHCRKGQIAEHIAERGPSGVFGSEKTTNAQPSKFNAE